MTGHYLIVEPESPHDPIQVYDLAPGCYVLGRSEADLELAHPDVAKRHALLFVGKSRIMIQDEDSPKGIYVDDRRVSPQTSVILTSSNNVALGGFLLYVADNPPANSSPRALEPKIYAGLGRAELTKLRRKAVDAAGRTVMPADEAAAIRPHTKATVLPVGGAKAAKLAAAPAAEVVEETRYTFPPMPAVPTLLQDQVDRFIYRRIKPLFDQLIQERTGRKDQKAEDVRDLAEEILQQIMGQQAAHIPGGLPPEAMGKLCVAAFMDYGVLQGLLGDETVTEIMVNGVNDIFIEQKGRLFKSHLRFWNEGELRRVIEKMVMITNRRIDEQQPYQDTRLEDGSRVNIIIRPISLGGDAITIRKFPNRRLGPEDLIKFGSLNSPMAEFLQRIVKFRANVIVSGGTGSGKTTLLNVLSGFIPGDERLVSIEDAAELRLVQPNKVTLEARPKSAEGGRAVTIRDLVINALRMRPDRIIVGECRGGEAMDMLQAMNTGHDGSLTTLHANSPRDAIGRLETMCLMAGMELPAKAIRSQIVSAVHFIVQQTRLSDGARKIVNISEILGVEGDAVVMQEIFKFERQGISPEGKVQGRFVATGVVPQFVSDLRDAKIDFPLELFER